MFCSAYSAFQHILQYLYKNHLFYELDRTLPREKNKKVIALMKYELG